MTPMSVDEAIRTRRSIRSFTGEPVSPADLAALVEAGRLAPSSLNSQPWRFKIVTSEADRTFLAADASRQQKIFLSAGAVFLCLADLSAYRRDSAAAYQAYEQSNLFSEPTITGIKNYVARELSGSLAAARAAGAMNVALAVTQMMLEAVSLGLGSCWVGMFDEAAVKARFGLGEELALVCLLAVGHPAEAPAPRPRKCVEEIVLP